MRQTPSFEEATRSRQPEVGGGMFSWTTSLATLLGVFALGSLVGYLFWRD